MAVHLFPSFTSHLIVTLTLMIPGMILGETALSFLGLGMQAPAVSWGVLLQDAQNIVTIAHHPGSSSRCCSWWSRCSCTTSWAMGCAAQPTVLGVV